jgi:ankyrin repeat protein
MNGFQPAGFEKKSFIETISYKHHDDDYYDYSDEEDDDYYIEKTNPYRSVVNTADKPEIDQNPSKRPKSSSEPLSLDALQGVKPAFLRSPLISAADKEQESQELTDLKHAIIHENIVKVESFLVKPDFNINASFNNGWSPLMYACSVGSYELAKRFIQIGANVNHSAGNCLYRQKSWLL